MSCCVICRHRGVDLGYEEGRAARARSPRDHTSWVCGFGVTPKPRGCWSRGDRARGAPPTLVDIGEEVDGEVVALQGVSLLGSCLTRHHAPTAQ